LPDGNYHAVLGASLVTDRAANLLDGNGDGTGGDNYSFDFFQLAADANRDRNVDFNDLVVLAQNYNSIGGMTFDKGDFNGDGNVDFNDLVILAQRYNTSLPAAAAAFASRPAVAAGYSAAPVKTGRPMAAPARPKPKQVSPPAPTERRNSFNSTRIGRGSL
jgi:hypothetical protein